MSEGVQDCKKFGNHCPKGTFSPHHPFDVSSENAEAEVTMGLVES